VIGTLQPVYFKNCIGVHFIIPLFGIITKLLICINCKGNASASVLFYTIVAVLNYRPKHVVSVMNKWIYSSVCWRCIIRRINKPTSRII